MAWPPSTNSTAQLMPLPPKYVGQARRLVEPLLDRAIHLRMPVFRMNAQNEHLIFLQRHRVVQLIIGIEIVAESLLLQPTEQAPLRRGQMARLTAFNGVGTLDVFGNVVVWLGPIERQRFKLHRALPFAVVGHELSRGKSLLELTMGVSIMRLAMM